MSLWFHRLDKITNEIISEFLPLNFLYLPGGFLEAFWGFLQASLFMILHTKSPGSPKNFHEAPRKLQKNSGQKSRNNFVGTFVQTMKKKGHFEINWPLHIVISMVKISSILVAFLENMNFRGQKVWKIADVFNGWSLRCHVSCLQLLKGAINIRLYVCQNKITHARAF